MNQKERDAVNKFKSTATGRLLVDKIEGVRSGMSDTIVYNRRGIAIWIEWKYLEKWPARATTVPLKNSFERGQLAFLRERRSWGVDTFVCLKVGSEWNLLNPEAPLKELERTDLMASRVELGLEEIITYLGTL